jgi:HD superfamily phosphodiesterase
MRERLLELIPEFDLIQDADLREKTIETWETAMEEGGWTMDDLLTMPFTLLINPCPVNFVEHTRAVAIIAIRAAEVFAEIYGNRVPVNMDLLISGGLLRDVGKPFTGMELAARCGLPVEVQHIIAAHAGEGDKVKRTTEGTIVNHADFISFHAVQRLMQKKELAAKMG